MLPDTARYSCQLALPGFGAAAQQLLQDAKVLIVGVGGLGCPAAMYLAASGAGTLGIADHDIISVSNLHRQVLYCQHEVGEKKVSVAQRKLQEQNPQIKLIAHDTKVGHDNVMELIAGYDLVLDATDNFETHYLLNDACVMAGKPLVHGAIYRYEGHTAVWNVQNADGSRSPNYRDVFPKVDPLHVPDCADGGVIPTIAGIIGCMQANEAIKLITRSQDVLAGKMLIFDAQTMQSRMIIIGAVTNTSITQLALAVEVTEISKAELAEVMKDADVWLVDVRSAEEYAANNIGGSNIPIDVIEDHREQLEDRGQVVFYCASGKRSMRAAKWLKELFPGKKVSSLKGGLSVD
jgi:molybdopterin/thiamine biosynthesis adenylyltransferase/rhodanese-related sulfurtransferase